MYVINEIISQSALGSLSKGFKSLVLSVFTSIVLTLFVMLIAIIVNGSQLHFSFGY
ncbi:hypothetical protein [Muriicola sp.]|uniref:hypothetical protein n=1 Tax=Muriicola sp. TaxID=2020856 RepID=UPI00356A3F23